MATSVYVSLLLNDYRRKKGDLVMIKKEMRDLARKALEIEGHVTALASIILSRDPGINLETARPISTWPRVSGMKHGRLTRHILTLLADAQGAPVGKEELVAYVLDQSDGLADREEVAVIRVAIQKCLKRLVAKGAVSRHHSVKTGSAGCWSLPRPAKPPSSRA